MSQHCLPSHRKSVPLSLAAVSLVYFASNFVLYSQSVTLPRIAAELNGVSLYSWAISLPALASALVTLIFGKLSDIYGRRALLVVSLALFGMGAVLSALSPTFVLFIAARCILGLGQGAIAPLCFSVLGDLFDPVERGKWAGLLAVPAGIAALIGPSLGGWLADALNWRYAFWITVPFLAIAGLLTPIGVPSLARRASRGVDWFGSILLALASSTMILGFSWAGSMYPWGSFQVVGALVASAVLWGIFLRVEARAVEPMLDLGVLTRRAFITAAAAALLSLFGLTAVMAYFPLFLQGVQGTSTVMSGQILTPFSVLMAFMGVPAGFLIARTRRYKWMYVAGYAILTATMFGMVFLTEETPIMWSFVVSALAGLGLGTIPTVNALVAQYAVPRRLLGVATGAMYFFVTIGAAVAPAILGSVLNGAYAKALETSLPAEFTQTMGPAAMASLVDPRVLLSAEAMTALQASFQKVGDSGPALFAQMVQAVRGALESGLRAVFWIGSATMAVSFLLILTIPEIVIGAETPEREALAEASPAS